jgi:hypothetical protein
VWCFILLRTSRITHGYEVVFLLFSDQKKRGRSMGIADEGRDARLDIQATEVDFDGLLAAGNRRFVALPVAGGHSLEGIEEVGRSNLATADTNSAAANEGLLVVKAVVKSLLWLSFRLAECLENKLPEAGKLFNELCCESEGNPKPEGWSAVVASEVHAFALVYYRLERCLKGQVADVGSLVNLVCDCLVSGPGKDRFILEVLDGLERDLPDVSTIGDGGRLLDLVDLCLFCTNGALESVASLIRSAPTTASGPLPLQDTQVDVVQVYRRLQEAIGCLLNVREHAAALLQVSPVERVAALLPNTPAAALKSTKSTRVYDTCKCAECLHWKKKKKKCPPGACRVSGMTGDGSSSVSVQVASVEPQQHSVSYSHRRSQTSLFFFLQIVISKFFFPV